MTGVDPPNAGDPADPASPVDPASPTGPAGPSLPNAPRPWLERIGLAAIATVMGALFVLVTVAAAAGGEWILAAMSGIGAFMTIAVGLVTLVRG
ncbi:MAG TPA: hypothetical protein VFK35_09505 [Candidatus Limnocylindrales bacterium]|nr:hypothetical protein [Candidatus Limnocylindrales bacterium]